MTMEDFRLLADARGAAHHLPIGVSLLEASAGTGKTWTLTHLVLRELLDDLSLDPAAVMMVTFTNAAAEELAERMRRVIADAVAALADSTASSAVAQLVALAVQRHGSAAVQLRLAALQDEADRLGISTIHAWCNRLLDQYARECGAVPGAALTLSDAELVAEAVRDAWRMHLIDDALLAAVAVNWGDCRDDEHLVRLWRQSTGTRLLPQVDDLAAAREALLAALDGSSGIPQGFEERLSWLRAKPKRDVVEPAVAKAFCDLRAAWLGWLCPWVDQRVRAAIRRSGSRTSDDILRELAQALQGPSADAIIAGVRTRTRLVLVDEFQDTDPQQWIILRTCFANGEAQRLVLIGDPKQAIYGFRGGDLPTYMQAVKTAHSAWRLGTSYRSCASLLRALDVLFAQTAPFADPDLAYHPLAAAQTPELVGDNGPALQWWLPDEPCSNKPEVFHRAGAWIAGEIQRLLSQGSSFAGESVHQGMCAVLVRDHGQARIMQACLRTCGLAAALNDGGDLLEAVPVQDLAAILAAAADLADRQALRRGLATVIAGWSAAQLAQDDTQEITHASRVLARIRRRWLRDGVAAAIQDVLSLPWRSAAEPAQVRLARRADGERWLTDLRHVADWLSDQLGGQAVNPAATLALLVRNGEDADRQERRLHLESDARAVAIITMHAAKGLQWPIVFCPALWTARTQASSSSALLPDPFPLRDASGPYLICDDSRKDEARQQRLAEDLRLTYVALTRARARCYVAWGAFGNFANEPVESGLGWLLRPAQPWTSQEKTKTARNAEAIRLGMEQRLAVAGPLWGRCQHASPTWEATLPSAPSPVPLLRIPAESLRTWTVASFTRITADHDVPVTADDDAMSAPHREMLPRDAWARLARGAGPGVALHAMLEHQDWSAAPAADVIRSQLQRHGLTDPAVHHGEDPVAAITALIEHLRTCDLGGWTLPEAQDRRDEWRFDLPLHQLRTEVLADLFTAHGGERARQAAPALRGLSSRNLRGFLTGSIDFLARVGDAWWVVDWKSNYLAPEAAGYTQDRCWLAMVDSAYILQYHLYALAVRRWRRRYGEAPCIRSAYVFLRGVPAACGVVTDTPNPALLDALEAGLDAAVIA